MQETSDLVHRCTPKDDDDLITTSANAAVFIHMLSVSVRVCVSEIKCIMKRHNWTIKQQSTNEIEVDIDEVGTYLFHIKNSPRLGSFISNVTKKEM